MAITLGFDVYGTLIDTAGIASALQVFTGEKTAAFTGLWRDKQLEYSFRRGLMQNYQHFAVCTRNALDYCCAALAIDIADQDREALMARYRMLPAFADVEDALPSLQAAGNRLFAFSNGRAEDVAALLAHAGISSYFVDVISTDEIKSFKPNPAVYAHFLRRAGATGGEAWLISGNPFDVIGAISAGMRGAWVKRTAAALFDPWEIAPTVTVDHIGGLAAAIATG
ncbi:MAG TPA: haloacid dehalogenase type II [Desulforhopalus sp.]|nr:haloacid dehalogenase type II [Desulforhopalus sp.]